MDLNIRLQILKDADQISLENYDAIIKVIEIFERELNIKLTEENGAMFITHLAIAFERIKKGEMVEDINDTIYEEIKNSSRFTSSEKFLELLEKELNIEIPESEKTFIMMHLCVLFESENIQFNNTCKY
ncbi:PRD domain-containing protein [Fonticella tunisiensis]|uniref:PRD domain-containing protein n=1 Tax=Fonticella tunisiensis TaxID=1096341 RepID=A0A4R7KQA9_9CLOT|nr:PRD domain-containing protein [Fonticella tunisiensis]TDT61329.1 PRD domain-containing protein [Fonticella tunisiensis]